MPIGVFTMVGIYIIVWWTVLFAVLPLGMAGETKEPPTDGAIGSVVVEGINQGGSGYWHKCGRCKLLYK